MDFLSACFSKAGLSRCFAGKKINTSAIKQFLDNNFVHLRSFPDALKRLSGGSVSRHGYRIKNLLHEEFEKNLMTLILAAHSDPLDFLQELNHFFNGGLSQFSLSDQVELCSKFVSLVFAHEHEDITAAILFMFSNELFDRYFSIDSYYFFRMILNAKDHALVRLIISFIWKQLGGDGWRNWHLQSIQNLKQDFDQGKTIVYLAGGSDIYQMVTHGIHSIYVIDPQLPVQKKYYTDDWEWLIKNGCQQDGGVGDKIVFDNHDFIMERVLFYETDACFTMKLSNGMNIQIPRSITRWNILNKQGVILGQITFDRRPVVQDDFVNQPNKTLLMSFNELRFVALPRYLTESWGINPTKFSDDFCLTVKQLERPVTRKTFNAMRIFDLLNAASLKFIALGSCVN